MTTESLDSLIAYYLSDLYRSQRPTILIGGGCQSYKRECRHLLEILNIPAFPTWNAICVVTSDLPNYGGRVGTYGGAGRNFGIQNSDLLLAIGSRISGRITGGAPETFARGAKKYFVDIDPALLKPEFQQVRADINILCDAGDFMRGLAAVADKEDFGGGERFCDWNNRVRDWKIKYDPVRPEFFEQEAIHPYAFIRTLSRKMDHNAVFVADCGGNIVVCNQAFETKWGQRYITNNGNSPMGFSMCGAIGAWFADPSRQVVCVIGDGGMNMNIQELQTIVNNNVNVKIFILNNHIYGITKQYQEVNFEGRAEACGPKGYNPPNFLRIAGAYRIMNIDVRNQSEVEHGIDATLNYPGPMICDVDCHEFHTYEPRLVGWKSPIEDLSPLLDRKEFQANMLIEPLPGWETGDY